jgi:exo-1,4-beta-D-glucosaminidase
VQSSATDPVHGSVVSQPDYRASGWYDASPRSTVMAALLHNGRIRDVSYSTCLRDEVDRSMFEVPWWFRTTFRSTASPGSHLSIRSDGIIPGADLWVNGIRVAGREAIAGAYTSNSFDVTHLVRRGANVLAYLVHPGGPMTDLSIGWVDWNQWPPDNNMGIWRDVFILPTGQVRLSHPRVTAELSPELDVARVVVTCDVDSLSGEPVVAEIRMTISGPTGPIELRGEVSVAGAVAGTTSTGTTATGTTATATHQYRAEAEIRAPAIWWPRGEGEQPLYDLEIAATLDGALSDRATASFGIRSIASDVAAGGGRRFFVNGRYTPIRGGGWSPDLFLRHDPQRIADELGYAADIGLNTIRLEGKGENPEFFERADEIGMLVMPGWECCNKWEAHAGTGGSPWDDHDFDVAERSMEAEAYRLGNHPSVFGFVIGSDFPPEPRACRLYVDALARARWDLPIISSATAEGTEEAGPSGMKMTGPYAWVPPSYWYLNDPSLGGAIGFNSETSAGNNIPRLASLERMLSAGELEQLWRAPEAKQFHAGPPSEFDNLVIVHRALTGRYGEPRSLRDFVAKAQLVSYEATRAQFEAYGARAGRPEPATGVVYWMLNSAWPSLNWQIWDHYLDPAAAYFGTKKANEPVHVQYDYGDRTVVVVNRTQAATPALALDCAVRDGTGAVALSRTVEVGSVAPGEAVTVMPVELPPGIGPTYFLELTLTGAGAIAISRNVYWLSTVDDVLALDQTTWQYTPTAEFADLRGLERLDAAMIEVAASTSPAEPADGQLVTTVTIRNVSPGGVAAVGLHASVWSAHGDADAADLGDADTAAPVAPVWWDDNDVTLFGGQSASVVASYAGGMLLGGSPVIEVDGFNLAEPVRVAGASTPS